MRQSSVAAAGARAQDRRCGETAQFNSQRGHKGLELSRTTVSRSPTKQSQNAGTRPPVHPRVGRAAIIGTRASRIVSLIWEHAFFCISALGTYKIFGAHPPTAAETLVATNRGGGGVGDLVDYELAQNESSLWYSGQRSSRFHRRHSNVSGKNYRQAQAFFCGTLTLSVQATENHPGGSPKAASRIMAKP